MTDVRSAGPFSAWERAIAGRYLRPKRKEGWLAVVTVLSFLGISLGVFALIAVLSIMNGFRADLLNRILGFNGHIYVGGQPLVSPDRDALIARLRQEPGVVQVMPMIDAQALVVGGPAVSGAIVRGVTPADLRRLEIVSSNIKRGSIEDFGKGEYGGDVIIVGDRLAAAMGVDVGDLLTLISPTGDATAFGSAPRRKQYLVGGLFSIGMSEYDQAYLYMPLEQAQIFFGRDSAVDVIEVTTKDPDRIDGVKAKVAELAGPGAVVTDWRDRNSSFFNALEVERTAMAMVLTLIIIVAGLNIISGLVMLVKNKGQDIAILRTIGASRGSVMRIFFMAGASLGLMGTFLGFLLGVLFCTYIEEIQQFVEWIAGREVFSAEIYFLSHVPAKLDWAEVGTICAVSVLITFIATLWPAFRASRLDPVEALRYE
jgi:lipoprotein-releasing system permease protein